jgi:PilX N-terminal
MKITSARKQGGAVLIISLLVLLLLAVLATSVSQTSLLQLHMAANEEAKVAALQRSLAVVDAVLALPGSTPLRGGVGYRICAVEAAEPGCDEASLDIDAGARPAAGSLDYVVTRVGPPLAHLPVMDEDVASSGIHYLAAKFEVRVSYDGTAQDLGRAALTQGVLVRVAVPAG